MTLVKVVHLLHQHHVNLPRQMLQHQAHHLLQQRTLELLQVELDLGQDGQEIGRDVGYVSLAQVTVVDVVIGRYDRIVTMIVSNLKYKFKENSPKIIVNRVAHENVNNSLEEVIQLAHNLIVATLELVIIRQCLAVG